MGKQLTKTECECVREELARLIGVRFEIMPVLRDFPAKVEEVEWYVRCPEWEDLAESAYANIAWKDRTGALWIRSLRVGDTFELSEGMCGGEAAMRISEVDFTGFDSQKVLAWFNGSYPEVAQQLNRYRGALEELSAQRGVPLELGFDCGNGIVFYSIRTKIDTAKLGLNEELSMLEPAVRALKDAFEVLGELDLKVRA